MKPLDAADPERSPGDPSFSLTNRIFRAIWAVTWLALASWTPPFFHGWRRLLLRTFGADIHPTALVYGTVRVWYPPNLRMSEHSSLGPRVNCYCMAKIDVGAHAVISQGTHLCAGSHDIDDPNFQLITKPIVIGSRAWIAAEAFVGPGVAVGEGAVLGARGVTFKSLECWTVYAGNPAGAIRKRRLPAPI